MALTEDQRIIAKAIDLITGVSLNVLTRARRYRDGSVGRGLGTRPLVSPIDLAELADAIEASYPGAIDAARAPKKER